MSILQLQHILLPILTLVRVVIAVQAFRVARQKNLPNLLWLSVFFCATGGGEISWQILGMKWLFGVGILISEIALVMFVHQTFYRDRKSPYLIFLGFAVISGVMAVNVCVTSTTSPAVPTFNPFGWGWLIVVAYQAYKQMAADNSVEDWIKVRYQLMIAYCVAYLVAPLLTVVGLAASFFHALGPFLAANAALMVISAQIASTVLQYLTWVMPEFFRRFLNRNLLAPSQEAQVFRTGLSLEGAAW